MRLFSNPVSVRKYQARGSYFRRTITYSIVNFAEIAPIKYLPLIRRELPRDDIDRLAGSEGQNLIDLKAF
jgi:hypothetical protein